MSHICCCYSLHSLNTCVLLLLKIGLKNSCLLYSIFGTNTNHPSTYTHTPLNLLRCLRCVLDKADWLMDNSRMLRESIKHLQQVYNKYYFYRHQGLFCLFFVILKALGRTLMHSRITFTWKLTSYRHKRRSFGLSHAGGSLSSLRQ